MSGRRCKALIRAHRKKHRRAPDRAYDHTLDVPQSEWRRVKREYLHLRGRR